jgi:hypothetical protein
MEEAKGMDWFNKNGVIKIPSTYSVLTVELFQGLVIRRRLTVAYKKGD